MGEWNIYVRPEGGKQGGGDLESEAMPMMMVVMVLIDDDDVVVCLSRL
jgi:hypothetical protein